MRITTRVSTGLFLMAGVLIAGLTYQLSQVERLQRINREVSLIKMESARISLRLLQALDGVQEFSAKYEILPDSAYRSQWSEWERAVEEDLALLASVGLADEEDDVRLRIERGWSEYRRATLPPAGPEQVAESEYFPRIQGILTGLRSEVEELIAVNEAVVSQQAISSAQATDRASAVAWFTATLALILAGLLSFLTYRSISGPLRRLTRGTREIALGRFDHRLDIKGPTELSSLAHDFDQMAARLDELDNLKRDFVSHVSHELKTPLAAIQETIEVLLEEIPGPLTRKQAHLLELSRSSSGRLSAMISDLLEMSRLEAGAAGYRPSWHSASELVRSVVDEMRPLADEWDIDVSFDEPQSEVEVACDANRMSEVLTNLLSNALKFSPDSTHVRVGLTTTASVPEACPQHRELARQEDGPFVLFSVEDEGPGVSDEDKDAIFEKFHQIGLESRHGGRGVGLGLAISLRHVEAHGGAIWVEDRPSAGAVFRVLVPRIPSQWAAALAGEPQIESSEPEDTRKSSAPRGSPTPAVLGALVGLLVSACSGNQPEPTPAPPGPELTPESAVQTQLIETPSSASVMELRLTTGWSFLSEGSYQEAYDAFHQVIEEAEDSRVAGEGLWGKALIHLLPESPYFDPDAAQALLDHLSTEFPTDGIGIQAAWVQRLLADLAEVRVMVDNQEEALRRLNETVDQLKSIDLNRAPRRSPPAARGNGSPTTSPPG